MNLDWMKEVDWEEGLTDDLKLVLSVLGEGAMLKLLGHLSGHRIYVSTTPIREAQRKYVRKFAGVMSPRAIAFKIGASESFVHKLLSGKREG